MDLVAGRWPADGRTFGLLLPDVAEVEQHLDGILGPADIQASPMVLVNLLRGEGLRQRWEAPVQFDGAEKLWGQGRAIDAPGMGLQILSPGQGAQQRGRVHRATLGVVCQVAQQSQAGDQGAKLGQVRFQGRMQVVIPQAILQLLAPPVEGALLPETYNYAWGDSRAEMIRRMSQAMTTTVEDLWAARDPALPLALGGFSFGGYVATQAASRLASAGVALERIVLVGPAARNFPLAPVPQDSIVIHGEVDDVVPLAVVLDWARPQVLPVVVVPGTGHFFHGQLPLLRQLIVGAWRR